MEMLNRDATPLDVDPDIAAISRIDCVPTLLSVVCAVTGMGFAAVARVTATTWLACAVHDDMESGLIPGRRLALGALVGGSQAGGAKAHFEPLACQAQIIVEHVSADSRYESYALPTGDAIESYVSVPIIHADGTYFGNLCAFDLSPALVAQPRILAMFQQFATLIATRLDAQQREDIERSALLDERAASELREQFIAILGHDLRNPLQAVYASADQLVRKLAYPAHAAIAERIRTNARRMSLLIDDVLDFARGRLGGGIGIELAETNDVNRGLQAIVQELRDAQPDAQFEVDIHVDRAVCCDLGRLQQVASNLLANALTHGRPDSPIRITASTDEHDLVLDVWNAGDPIPPESLDKIFEPFWRRSVSGSRNGLGLGLYICSEIIRAHGGRISVTSTAADGTRFTARLPLPVQRPVVRIDALAQRRQEQRLR